MARPAFVLIVALSFLAQIEGSRPLPGSEKGRNQIKSLKVLDSLFWGNYSGQNFLTLPRHQNRPEYCESSWAFAATSALSDRFKIMQNNQSTRIFCRPPFGLFRFQNTNPRWLGYRCFRQQPGGLPGCKFCCGISKWIGNRM